MAKCKRCRGLCCAIINGQGSDGRAILLRVEHYAGRHDCDACDDGNERTVTAPKPLPTLWNPDPNVPSPLDGLSAADLTLDAEAAQAAIDEFNAREGIDSLRPDVEAVARRAMALESLFCDPAPEGWQPPSPEVMREAIEAGRIAGDKALPRGGVRKRIDADARTIEYPPEPGAIEAKDLALLRDLLAQLKAERVSTRARLQRSADLRAMLPKGGMGFRPECGDDDDVIERLRDELTDWREGAASAAREDCGGYKHCTCVAGLRKELADARHLYDVRNGDFEICKAELATAYATIERVRHALSAWQTYAGNERRTELALTLAELAEALETK